MLWMLLACGGPIDLPRLDVILSMSSTPETLELLDGAEPLEGFCHPDRQPFLRGDGDEGEIVNRSNDARLVEILPAIENASEAVDVGGVVVSTSIGSELLALGEDEPAPVVVHAALYCVDGEPTGKGRHNRDLTVVSTDEFGGDIVEQAFRITVIVKD